MRRGADTAFDELRLTVGGNIQRLRAQRGWTQARLGEALDVTVEHLRGVEGGHRTPSLRLLFEASRILECSIADLFASGPRESRRPGRPRKSLGE